MVDTAATAALVPGEAFEECDHVVGDLRRIVVIGDEGDSDGSEGTQTGVRVLRRQWVIIR